MKYKLSIGQVSKMYGISLDTLRHYDKIGILKPFVDKTNGYRYYSFELLDLLEHILVGKYLEIPLKEMKNVFQHEDINQYRDLIERQEEIIEEKMNRLERMKKYVHQLKMMMHEISSFKNNYDFSELLIENIDCTLYVVPLPELVKHYKDLESKLSDYQVENYAAFYRNDDGKMIENDHYLLFSIYPEEQIFMEQETITNIEIKRCIGECIKAKFYGTKAELADYLSKLISHFYKEEENVESLVNYEFCLIRDNELHNEYFVEILLPVPKNTNHVIDP
ncbi:MerR family DNA-binding transcriptional regulator [Paenibacillus azoreducens]|uniref:MerR family DNA-binding transcriptional regulator n=1 Tax=Paenibacillus azoreducens TaxID=116718 RepID=UPI0039F5B6EA